MAFRAYTNGDHEVHLRGPAVASGAGLIVNISQQPDDAQAQRSYGRLKWIGLDPKKKPWLVGGIPIYPSEKYEVVNWDDDSQDMGKTMD